MSEQNTPETGNESAIIEFEQIELTPPPKYNVLLHNDDYTPMDFVIDVLQRFFRMDHEAATEVMLNVHYKGTGVCGVFSAEIAETKVMQVTNYAKENEHPLKCTMEKES